MELPGNLVTIVLLLLLISTPIVAARYSYKKFNKIRFVYVYLISLPVIGVLAIFLSYWPHFYTDFRLVLMGFDFSGMTDESRLRNVEPHLREEADRLYWSNMGVGWPLTAMVLMIPFSIYPLFVLILIKICSHIRPRV